MADKLEDVIDGLAIVEQVTQYETPDIDLLQQAKLTTLEKVEAESFLVLGLPGFTSYPKTEMLGAYLGGSDTPELLELFPGTSIGGIAYLKVKENWIEKRKEFLEDLTYKTRLKTVQTKSNAINMLSLLLDGFHKEMKPKLMKYLQTGDKIHLPPHFRIRGYNDYSKFVKLFETMSKMQAVTTKNTQENNYYPPVTIQTTGSVNIDKKDDRVIEAKKPEDMSAGSFDFLKEVYDAANKK